jgi:hypothetical protein
MQLFLSFPHLLYLRFFKNIVLQRLTLIYHHLQIGSMELLSLSMSLINMMDYFVNHLRLLQPPQFLLQPDNLLHRVYHHLDHFLMWDNLLLLQKKHSQLQLMSMGLTLNLLWLTSLSLLIIIPQKHSLMQLMSMGLTLNLLWLTSLSLLIIIPQKHSQLQLMLGVPSLIIPPKKHNLLQLILESLHLLEKHWLNCGINWRNCNVY